jgi:hypothetical protein
MNGRLIFSAAAALLLAGCPGPQPAHQGAQPAPGTPPPAGSATYIPGAALLNPADVANTVAGSPCAAVFWRDRGRAPIGFIKGMAVVHAQSFCELRSGGDVPALAMSRPPGDPRQDVLPHYGMVAAMPAERLLDLHTLGIGFGMRESSGNPQEGRDMSASNVTGETAEAGLFQTSFNAMRQPEPWLQRLYDSYRAAPERCHAGIFAEGVRPRTSPEAGSGPGVAFQRFTKDCPAFAADYAMLMLRANLRHYGPIIRRDAEVQPACRALLQQVEGVARCRI